MKRDKDNQTLTRVEMEIMNRLWAKDKPSASVRELLAEYPDPKPAYTTLGTYMKILTQKGFVKPEKHEDDGKTYFEPRVKLGWKKTSTGHEPLTQEQKDYWTKRALEFQRKRESG